MLTPLQSRVLRLVHEIPGADSIALAGGGALIVRGLVDRMTRDLDLFATVADEVDVFLPALEEALHADGLTVERRQIAHGFARLLVTGGGERTVVDLAADYRLQPAEPTDLGLILSEEELATDKVLAVFGRAEARDYIDLAALEPRYGLDHLCRLAAIKDPGFDRDILVEMLGSFTRLDRREFPIGDDAFEELSVTVDSWIQALQDEDGAPNGP